MKQLTSMILALTLAFFLAGPVDAQETPAADAPTAQTTNQETRNDDSGRWGLLGLLGLAGLAGLMRRPQNEVRTVDRTGTTR